MICCRLNEKVTVKSLPGAPRTRLKCAAGFLCLSTAPLKVKVWLSEQNFSCQLMVISHLYRTPRLHYLTAAAAFQPEFLLVELIICVCEAQLRCRFEMKIGSQGNTAEAQQLWGIFRYQNTHTCTNPVWKGTMWVAYTAHSQPLKDTHQCLLHFHNWLHFLHTSMLTGPTKHGKLCFTSSVFDEQNHAN